METYTAMRHFADSWGLLGMFLVFIGVIVFVFRPGSAKQYQHDAMIPLRDDEED
ncbi:MAG: cbb3-type cytochrome c oxidase subunit 3 [Hyphomicrobiales bacterium]